MTKQSKNRRYVFVTVPTLGEKYRQNSSEENQQNDMSLNFSEDLTICFFRSGSGVNATFSNSFRFNEIEGNGAPGETRTRAPPLTSRSNYFAKSCRRSG